MNYVYVTKNTQHDLDAMNSYIGTTLLHTDTTFLVWLWTDPRGPDLDATQGINPSVNLVAMAMINVV